MSVLKRCEWHACGQEFQAQHAATRHCPKHERRRGPPRCVQARQGILRVIAERVRRVGPSFRVKDIHHILPGLSSQGIARTLHGLAQEGVLAEEGSKKRRRYRFVGPLGLLDDATRAG